MDQSEWGQERTGTGASGRKGRGKKKKRKQKKKKKKEQAILLSGEEIITQNVPGGAQSPVFRHQAPGMTLILQTRYLKPRDVH